MYDHSDTGNAELLNHLFGENIRYDSTSQRWLQWNSGHRWVEMEESALTKLAIKTANHRFDLAQDPTIEKAEAKHEFAFAIRSRDENRLASMLAIARHLSPIGNVGIAWDNKPNYLAVSNGIVNLTTGTLRTGARSDYISQGIDIPYDPSACAPVWTQFISDIMLGNQEHIAYLQRAIGYTLTGFTLEQVFFLLHGGGSNGKSVLTNIMIKLLSGFAKTVRFSAFEEKASSADKLDLAELPGIRAAFASEGDNRRTIDTTIIKDITGAAPITTRKLYKNPFTFTPQFKLWLTTNQLPKIRDDSYGFWRRVVIIPFDATFEGVTRDNYMQIKLEHELPGILAWAVRGAVEWNAQKLVTPISLLLRINEYREESDELELFITANCIRNEVGTIRATAFYEAYRIWCGNNSTPPMTSTSFGKKMGAKFEKIHDREGWYYKGIHIEFRFKVE